MSIYSLREMQMLVEAWQRQYNMVRAHCALGYRLLTPEAAPVAGIEEDNAGATI
jgi:hypothetical protein